MAEATSIDAKQVAAVLDSLLSNIERAVCNGEKVGAGWTQTLDPVSVNPGPGALRFPSSPGEAAPRLEPRSLSPEPASVIWPVEHSPEGVDTKSRSQWRCLLPAGHAEGLRHV